MCVGSRRNIPGGHWGVQELRGSIALTGLGNGQACFQRAVKKAGEKQDSQHPLGRVLAGGWKEPASARPRFRGLAQNGHWPHRQHLPSWG